MPKKPRTHAAYSMLNPAPAINPDRSFMLVGKIDEVTVTASYIEVRLRLIDYTRDRTGPESDDIFTIYFQGEAKKILREGIDNKRITVKDTAIIHGELNIKKTDIGLETVYLAGKYLNCFRNGHNSWEEPVPVYVKPEDLPDKGQAY
jgi:hypothetical protein